jgi:hypothetical protein
MPNKFQLSADLNKRVENILKLSRSLEEIYERFFFFFFFFFFFVK